jgi:hypothetical protein
MIVPQIKNNYKNWHYGISGKIGDGNNTEIYFLQTSLKMKDLESIKLLVDIPGSEKWSIKDLFQRTVDRDRIVGKGSLTEYFKDKSQIKYFNPIALVLLPEENNEIEHNLPKLAYDDNVKFDNIQGSVLTYDDRYRLFLQNSDQGNIGKIEWNEEKCYVVAVDGQHRLTALKELYATRNIDPNIKDITGWQIPVVFIVVNKKVASGASKDFISIIRRIFMCINMKAKEVNDSRSILLNDESLECLCVQEIVGAFHENETQEDKKRKELPPLYLIDWIGLNKDSSLLKDTRYLFSNIELRAWIREYLVGEDFSPTERKADKLQLLRLELIDINLDCFNRGSSVLTHDDAKKIRKKFNSTIRAPFIDFLIQLSPIEIFIKKCRDYEEENSSESSQITAFSELRYGYSQMENSNKNEIITYINNFKTIILSFKKESMSDFFRQDICMRGIVFAYSELYDVYKSYLKEPLEWQVYNEKFLKSFNKFIEEGWCDNREDLDDEKREYLTHVSHDDTGKVVNYKLEHVKNAWGVFVSMHVLKNAVDAEVIPIEYMDDLWSNYRDRLFSTLQKGFRDVVKREVAQIQETDREKKRIIDKKKVELANERLGLYEEMWGLDHDEESY